MELPHQRPNSRSPLNRIRHDRAGTETAIVAIAIAIAIEWKGSIDGAIQAGERAAEELLAV